MRALLPKSLSAWLAGHVVAMFGVTATSGRDLLTILPGTLLALLMLGPLFVALTAPSFAVSLWAVSRFQPRTRAGTFATVVAAYLVTWLITVAVLAWVPPVGNPSKTLEITPFIWWFGPVTGVVLGWFMARMTRPARAEST